MTPYYSPRSNPDGWAVTVNCIDQRLVDSVTYIDYDGKNWEKSYAATGIAVYSKPVE